jgi:hypothetical protein
MDPRVGGAAFWRPDLSARASWKDILDTCCTWPVRLPVPPGHLPSYRRG